VTGARRSPAVAGGPASHGTAPAGRGRQPAPTGQLLGATSAGRAGERVELLDAGDLAAQLRQAIVDGSYAPRQRLVERDLCEQFGVGRFLVRRALQDLVGEGLVELERHRGARVRAISIEQAVEITLVRSALECLAARLAAERISARALAELRATGRSMRRAVEQLDFAGYSDLNAQLHRQVRSACGNATCVETLERLRAQTVRHQFGLALQPGRPAVSLVEHEAIIAGVAARDPDAAESAMRRHLLSVVAALGAMPSRWHDR